MRKNILVYVLLVLLILVGAWFRIPGILEEAFSFTYDVGRDLLAVESMVRGYKISLLGPTTGLEGLFYGPWWYYFLAIPFILTNGDPKGIALFIALVGVANIILAFIIGRKIGGTFLAIVCASLISVSPFFINTSSQIWSPNIIPTLVLLVIFFFFKIVRYPVASMLIWLILGLLLTLIIEMEIVFGLLFIVAAVISLVAFLRKKITLRRIAFFLAGILIIEMPRILFEARHEFLMTKRVLAVLGEIFKPHSSSLLTKENFIEMQSAFSKIWSDAVAGDDQFLRILLLAFFAYVFVIYYRRSSPFEKFFFRFITLTIAIFVSAFIFFQGGLWGHYLVGLPVLFVFFAGMSLNLLRGHFAIPKLALALLFAIVWLNLNPIRLFIRLQEQPWRGDEAVYRNQIEIIDYIYREANGEKFKYVLYTPPVHDYTYRYLFSWYGKKRYNKVPSEQDAKFSFFIIEPDNIFWHRPNEWLESRKSDGKVVKEKRFGWVVVQTRVPN